MVDIGGGDADVHEAMACAGWSDGLPLVPPTPERVALMMQGTSRPEDEEIGRCPPMYGMVTVRNVAVNAVMAGCEARHLVVVLAAVEAMLADEFNLHGVHATTMGATPVVLVSGPVRHDAGLNSAHGALGSGSRANACIGRAIKLVLQNVGGAKLGGTESTTLGSPSKFTLCIAEAEETLEGLDGWLPYHRASRGHAEVESVVTVVAATSGPAQLVDFLTRDAPTLVSMLGEHLAGAYAPHMPLVNECILVISPEHLTTLSRGGVRSKAELCSALWHSANRASVRKLPSTLVLAGKGSFLFLLLAHALLLLSAALSLVADVLSSLSPGHWQLFHPLHSIIANALGVPKFVSPESFHLIVAGAPAGKFSAYMSGFGVGLPPRPTARLSVASSVLVERPPDGLAARAAAAAAGTATPGASLRSPRSPTAAVAELPSPASTFNLVKPTGLRMVTPHEPLERPETLDGIIGLVDISKAGGKTLLDTLESRLLREFPHLRCKRFTKPTFSRPMPDGLAQHIAESQCTFVVSALAD
jgi:hypothetical protein